MINKSRIIIYYQTLIDLNPLINLVKSKQEDIVTDITLASIHFGTNNDKTNSPYIHLNNNTPNSKTFDVVYSQLKEIKNLKQNEEININLLIGGAGTAFNQLFSNYDCYYNLLKTALENELNFIDGFNLDIEEEVDLNNIIKFVNDLKQDFPDKKIIFAPLAESIATDAPGMGGFSYKDLNNKIGDKIEYFNIQCYGEYSLSLFNKMVSNGYEPNKIVMGMLTGQDFNKIIDEVETIVSETQKTHKIFGGVAVWEYFNAPPSSPEHPFVWCEIMSHLLYDTSP